MMESFEELVKKVAEFEEREQMMIEAGWVGDDQMFDSEGNLMPPDDRTCFEVAIEKGIPLPEGVDRAFWENQIRLRQQKRKLESD